MLKVLIVDDETVVRRGIVLGVDWASMDCVVVGEAANGEEGLAAAERYNPNLIITDVRMPRMDGIEMMRRLREKESTAHFIILTAHDEFDYARAALRYGAADYLLKPFRDQDLMSAIARVREKEGAAQPAEDTLLLPKGDKSKYVLQTLNYIAEHYADTDINIASIARPPHRHQRGAFEPCVQEGDQLYSPGLSHPVPHPYGPQAAAGLPVQGVRGGGDGGLPRRGLFRQHVQKAHRHVAIGVSGPMPLANCTKTSNLF